MKAVEFESVLSESGTIALPPDAAAEIPAGEQVRVVVMWEQSNEWTGRRAFEAAYAPEDSVYEQLIDDKSSQAH